MRLFTRKVCARGYAISLYVSSASLLQLTAILSKYEGGRVCLPWAIVGWSTGVIKIASPLDGLSDHFLKVPGIQGLPWRSRLYILSIVVRSLWVGP